ncbi:hypothetical protein [Limibacillus sp. MBR-115]|jgi:hypothetical protein|uniref:hypothetical protein n=1 Tax=Limibacillus sp. MBR-115 TaxID=3156465 RepID=UPI0033995392
MQSIDPQTDLPKHLLCDHHALVGALARVQQEDGASLPLLEQAACGRYLKACDALSYRPARPVVGSGDKEVHQDFAVCMDIAATSPLRTLATQLQAALLAAAFESHPPLLDSRFHFNDFIVQAYPRNSRGITPHVDHIRYQGLVAIIVFSGQGDFALCDDRSGRNTRHLPAGPGDLLLMRAPGFAASTKRPFHQLTNVRSDRVILGLRWDTREGEPW